MRDIQKLTAAVQQINDALKAIRNLDWTEGEAMRGYERISVMRERSGYGRNEDSPEEKAIIASMRAAGKRRAAELGREARTAAIENARAVIEQYRAILPGLAAAAAIEVGIIARDAE